jgi:hypothetical protein
VPRAAVAFFAPAEAGSMDADVRMTPVREEQLKERPSKRFRQLDIPLLLVMADGRRRRRRRRAADRRAQVLLVRSPSRKPRAGADSANQDAEPATAE